MAMDEVFRALADPTRRRLLDSLNARNGQTLRELGEGTRMTRQAVTKHLAVLQSARLVTSVRHGREKWHYLNPVPIAEIGDRWIHRYERSRMTALSTLRHALEDGPLSKPEFVYVTYIKATPEMIYRGLTEREFLDVYLAGAGPQSDWQVGSTVLWKSLPDGDFEDLDQQVLVAEPGRRLQYSWHRLQPMQRDLFDSEEAFEAARQEKSRVTFDIEPAEIPELGTKLTITHDGFDSPDSKMLEGTSGGWVMILSALKTHLEGGKLLGQQ